MIRKLDKRLSDIFIYGFVIVSIIEIIAEFFNDVQLIWIFKPMLIPLLLAFYVVKSKKVNLVFVLSLLFSWIANLIFISKETNDILLGSFFFLVYRSLIIYLVFKLVKLPTKIPLILGSIPFLFIYTTVCFLSFEVMGNSILVFIMHSLFIVFLGGYSLGSFIITPSRSNLYLFVSTMLFAVSQFVFVLKFYSRYDYLLHSVAMLLFVVAQFYLTKFILIKDSPKTKYEFVTSVKEL